MELTTNDLLIKADYVKQSVSGQQTTWLFIGVEGCTRVGLEL